MVEGRGDGVRRVLVLAPMPIELAAVVKALGLTKHPDRTRRGIVSGTEVVAALAGLGPAQAAAATRRLIEVHDPTHVVVCGVAGGIGAAIKVGDLVVPAVVIDVDGGDEHHAAPLGDVVPAGRLITTPVLIVDRDHSDAHAAAGVDAVDMETAAIAEVCEEHHLPWTAFRGVSDHYVDEIVGDDTMDLMHADGTPDFGAVARYVAKRPANVKKLARMARDTKAATAAATQALLAALQSERAVS